MAVEVPLENKFVFMHIGKTAGTTVKTVAQSTGRTGGVGLIVEGHTSTLEFLVEKFPNAKISVIMRDPLERIISGFNSRLRQGRPVYDRIWSAKEAAAFSLFKDVESFLRACISTSDADISAARFACSAIKHIKNGYARCFGDASTVSSQIGRFYCIGHITNMRDTLAGIFAPFGVDPGVYETVAPQHASRLPASDILDRFNQDEMIALRSYFGAEYSIYNQFMHHVSVRVACRLS